MADCSMVGGHIDRETNYDRIRKMSPEEMADFLISANNDNIDCCDYCVQDECDCNGKCTSNIMEWLEQEATDEQT